jgi:hypothetical protein
MERGMRNMNWIQGFMYIRESRVEFVSDRMSYIILRHRWFHIIVLNVHAPTEDKTDDVKDSSYEELDRIFDKFPKYHMKNFVGKFQHQSRQRRHF